MPEDYTSRDSNQQYRGNAPNVGSQTTGGMRNARIGDAKSLDQAWDKEGPQRPRNGSPIFYALLDKMADVHDRKSHDYASNSDPSGNYHFAGKMSQLFKNPDDAGFIGRIGEKLYRLANLENPTAEGIYKQPRNESVEDTEDDLCVIMVLWMADRRNRRMNMNKANARSVIPHDPRDQCSLIVGPTIPKTCKSHTTSNNTTTTRITVLIGGDIGMYVSTK